MRCGIRASPALSGLIGELPCIEPAESTPGWLQRQPHAVLQALATTARS
ncbi:hypothetical protein [Nocardia abscessus]|nr:hypothetical protein [Nocardia abscessus]MCC3332279.1 hypothetical protein [Nocardia abscessus]